MTDMPANPNKTPLLRKLDHVDIHDLQQAVSGLSKTVWEQTNHTKPNRFAALNKTQHIVFKFIDSFSDWRKSHTLPLWKEWEHLILPVIQKAVTPYQYEKGEFSRIMLALLPAGEKITRHIDGAPAAQFPHKLHIPIITNSKTFFCFDKQRFNFETGAVYEVNNNIYHWAENNGDTNRVHLIFEYFPVPG
ncbi:MAG: aspartyl/asparaginyl beta-hydroxylase domain-containing protein [Roseivirga sp.]|nr:aspartyl/asparaginyl beta-hydroxylase domain-containing protein [Roseivirga sp.]